MHLKRINSYTFLLIFSFVFLQSCDHNKDKKIQINRAFYFWKSTFRLSNYEKRKLDSLNVQTLYVKFFDVDWSEANHQPEPKAQIRIYDAAYFKQKIIIPTVFITNQCIYKLDSAGAKIAAAKILKLVKEIALVNALQPLKEIQIDCDWTESNRDKYFSLLKYLVDADTTVLFSATIRLHQVKYASKTGIPPVQKGLLMCYNMGNLKSSATTNSILESDELKKYINNLNSYPLPLDVGLPLFEWNVLLRNNNFAGLIEDLPAHFFDNKNFQKKNNLYRALSDTVMSGYTFKKDDIIRNEKSDYSELQKTIKLIKEKLPASSYKMNLSLYHLDSLTLSKYQLDEIENIYNGLR